MRLKRLEVFGFKSFFDKTVITFRKGITGIVGPNGCGKSNFADAILWVLGEQSPKSLRGGRMEDVIFSGTEHRKPLSVAEVSLTIGDIENELPAPYTPYAELTLSRRLYRSGESDYLINKSPCRLKDIRDLLIDMGAGYHAHTIIEQGKVDDLITASPLQRREIVEEAAGISKYRLRKAEALRKLEATERNLTRVSDIISEIKRQRNGLDRQAKKAEKVKEMSASLKGLELQVARYEWVRLKAEEDHITHEETALQDMLATQSAQLGAFETAQTEHKFSITKKEETLSGMGRNIAEVEKNIQRQEAKIEMIRAQREEWQTTQSRTDQEMGHINHEILSLKNEESALKGEETSITETLPASEASLIEHETQAKRLEKQVLSEDTELEQRKVLLFDFTSQLTTAKNNLIHFQSRKDMLFKQKDRLRIEQEVLDEKLIKSQSALKTLQETDQKNSEELTVQDQKLSAMKDRLETTEEILHHKRNKLLQAKEERGEVKAQIASHEGFYRGFLNEREGTVNHLLQLDGLQGMVADLVDVPSRYELALEAALDNKLRGIVVEGHHEIKKGITHLRDSEMGRGTFFPRHPRISKNLSARAIADEKGQGIIGHALDLVSVQARDASIAEALLDGIVMVTDLEAALAAWEKYPDVTTWVTLRGEIIDQFGVVSGGEQGEKGLLGQKRALQLLSKQSTTLHQEAQSLQDEIDRDQDLSETIRLEMTRLSEQIRALDVEQLKGQNDLSTLSDEIERLVGEGETVLFELEEGLREEETLCASIEAEHQLIAQTEQSKLEKEREIETLKQILSENRQTMETLNETVVALRMKTNSLKEKQQHTLEKQTRLGREKENLTLRLEEIHMLKTDLQKKLSAGQAEAGEAATTIETWVTALSGKIETLRKEQESHSELLSTQETVEKEIVSLRSLLSQSQETLQKKALKKVSVEMNRQKIEETIFERHQIKIDHHSDSSNALSVESAQAQAASLRQKIENVGPVNLAAIEEYKELDTRFQFLSGQEEDLNQSIERLKETIAKINKTTRGLFVETFHTLNEKFGEIYTSFFGGGSAELVLLDEAHPLESGIEMLAQPPGKGKRNILLLSGGEKALTAISLLFATFLIHPTPFCLLDEIDAPLDEENTRRFSETLIKMSDQTQFIVVTHNKFTMEIADVLYGVTMEETGISKLVSVNLNTHNQEEIPSPVTAG